MEVLLILIHLHEVLIYSIIFLISYIELWDSSALIMNLYMLFSNVCKRKDREEEGLFYNSLIVLENDNLLS